MATYRRGTRFGVGFKTSVGKVKGSRRSMTKRFGATNGSAGAWGPAEKRKHPRRKDGKFRNK